MENVADKALELLRALAEKLGTTIEHLWPVVVRQQWIEAVTNMLSLGSLAAVLVGIALYASGVRKARRIVRLTGKDFAAYRMSELESACAAISLFAGLIGVLIAVLTISTNLPAFLNPEYYAIRDLLRLVRGKG